MPDSRHLHAEAAKIRHNMQEKLNLADRSNLRVEAYNKAGDFKRATLENELAIRYYKEALGMEYEAVKYDNKASEIEGIASDLEKKETELQTKCHQQIEQLEKQRKQLLGN